MTTKTINVYSLPEPDGDRCEGCALHRDTTIGALSCEDHVDLLGMSCNQSRVIFVIDPVIPTFVRPLEIEVPDPVNESALVIVGVQHQDFDDAAPDPDLIFLVLTTQDTKQTVSQLVAVYGASLVSENTPSSETITSIDFVWPQQKDGLFAALKERK